MEITKTKDGTAAMLSLRGELDADTAPQLSAALDELGEVVDLALDLDGLKTLTTVGLGAILRAAKKTEGKGSFSLVRVPHDIADLLRMTGLYGRLDVYEKE